MIGFQSRGKEANTNDNETPKRRNFSHVSIAESHPKIEYRSKWSRGDSTWRFSCCILNLKNKGAKLCSASHKLLNVAVAAQLHFKV